LVLCREDGFRAEQMILARLDQPASPPRTDRLQPSFDRQPG
jgi:hypothetical protein